MTIADEQLKEWRALAEAATPGPWRFEAGEFAKGGHVVTAAPVDQRWAAHPILISHFFHERDRADMSLIATSRTAVPALLDECERLRGEVDVLKALANDPRHPMACGLEIRRLKQNAAAMRPVVDAADSFRTAVAMEAAGIVGNITYYDALNELAEQVDRYRAALVNRE